MVMKECPQCRALLDDTETVCPGCGYSFQRPLGSACRHCGGALLSRHVAVCPTCGHKPSDPVAPPLPASPQALTPPAVTPPTLHAPALAAVRARPAHTPAEPAESHTLRYVISWSVIGLMLLLKIIVSIAHSGDDTPRYASMDGGTSTSAPEPAPDSSTNDQPSRLIPNDPRIVISDESATQQGAEWVISGTVTNNLNTRLAQVEITYLLIDDSGHRQYIDRVTVGPLEPHASAPIAERYIAPDATKCIRRGYTAF